MNSFLKNSFCFALLSGSLVAADDAPTVIDNATKSRIIQGLKSSNEKTRSAAIHSVHFLGKPALEDYPKILSEARVHHEKKLYKMLQKPYASHHEQATVLDRERSRIYELILTDYKKDPGEIAMLRREMKSLERPFKNAMREAKRNPDEDLEEINQQLDVLRQIHFELLSFERGVGTEDWSPSSGEPTDLTLERKDVLRETLGGEDFIDQKARFEQSRREAENFATVAERNESLKNWATGPMKDFNEILNSQRALLGLGSFSLEERLSDAARGHSEDMKRLGFFAHTSPVPGKSSPADRARMAKFEHNWSGENIFMGSSSPQAAYDAWFASDGHRFIMMSRGPDLIGVGIADKHWTMMTGTTR